LYNILSHDDENPKKFTKLRPLWNICWESKAIKHKHVCSNNVIVRNITSERQVWSRTLIERTLILLQYLLYSVQLCATRRC